MKYDLNIPLGVAAAIFFGIAALFSLQEAEYYQMGLELGYVVLGGLFALEG